MDDSPEGENNDKEEEEYWQIVGVAQATIAYQAIYSYKEPYMTSSFTANEWIEELMSEDANTIRCYQMFRMDKIVFNSLMHDLVTTYGLKGSRNIDMIKMLEILFLIFGHGVDNKLVQERFQCSGVAISR
ncbi:Protein-serine/threonine phosphatase [Psidium guajava]|nr:Protein-serine/threonine phosphatase [Psidium guajava]